MLVSALKWYKKPYCQLITPWWVRALARAEYIYVDKQKDRSKINFLIHVPVHSSDERKVLGDFFNKYYKGRPTKDYRQEPATKKNIGWQQYNNDIVQHTADEIILKDNLKLSVRGKTHENTDDEVNEDDLYDLDQISLDDKELCKRVFERKLKNTYDIERSNSMNYIH